MCFDCTQCKTQCEAQNRGVLGHVATVFRATLCHQKATNHPWIVRCCSHRPPALVQVYTSHMQLGGPRIMGVNGVSHHLVADDLEGARKVLAMLAFAPPEIGSGPANLLTSDPTTRQVTYLPAGAEKFDPRAAFGGRLS